MLVEVEAEEYVRQNLEDEENRLSQEDFASFI